ncbi:MULTISPECIES: DUF3465 domain-containing protein [Acinetobacter]|uniref:DUF3465 domain-containing protein n=1 Tax=Acinetobacter TaxID=469 RepID=UPI000537BB04|nr:DUF3465 domain-containing protein [Acinetobacter sp. HR7]KGT48737.1 hypothetical protein GW12_02260 [Acinetobacter sp. HR7]
MANKTNMGIGAVIALLVAAYLGLDLSESKQQSNNFAPAAEVVVQEQAKVQQPATADDTYRIEQAYQQRQSDLQVQASGQVVAVLKDDNEGSRHQKFILELSNGQTVLVAHNIDLAPRIGNIQKGDQVEFYGEYEYSDKGGVIHWTHHDPSRKHVDGWLKHQGRMYQ